MEVKDRAGTWSRDILNYVDIGPTVQRLKKRARVLKEKNKSWEATVDCPLDRALRHYPQDLLKVVVEGHIQEILNSTNLKHLAVSVSRYPSWLRAGKVRISARAW